MSEAAIIVLLAAGLVAALMWRSSDRRDDDRRSDASRVEPVGDGTSGTATSVVAAHSAQLDLQRRHDGADDAPNGGSGGGEDGD